ncbi:MAG: SDR family oxidoreductase [Candidatus Krumholzibacteriia bacterium]
MDLQLNGKVAAVAAASQGLGFACALELAREGGRVGICSRSEANLGAAAERITGETGAEVFTHVTDVSDTGAAAGFVNAVAGNLGGVDILVTNAGGPPPGGYADVDTEKLERGFRLTMMSTIAMMQAAIPHMRRGKWGRIVNVLSITAKQPETNLLVSNTMRAGLVGYTKSVSQELAADNVLVNNVAPGYTRTERLDELATSLAKTNRQSTEEVYAGWEEHIPMRRLGRPEELGRVVAFLSSEAASYVTGVTIQVDGGFVKGLL